MPDWTASGGIKIERAKEHVDDLVAEIKAFMQSEPYGVFSEAHADTGDWVVRARIHHRPPARWGAIAGDAIHNLRAALDILWRCAMYPDGGGDSHNKTEFAIYSSADKFEAAQRRVVKSARKPAVALYRALKPYKSGNSLLWLLHEADNIDKHRLLIPAYSQVSSIKIEYGAAMRQSFRDPSNANTLVTRVTVAPKQSLCPVEDGAELWRVNDARRLELEMKPKFAFEIAFGETGILKGKPVIPTLYKFGGLVHGIAEQFLAAGLVR